MKFVYIYIIVKFVKLTREVFDEQLF